MPSMESSNSSSTSGIATSATGERLIPSSTRADGSVRKEIRVRPGYRPPEDVEVYKNRTAEAWKTRGKGGVPGAQFVEQRSTKPAQPKSKGKNAKASSESTGASEKLENGAGSTDAPNAETAPEPSQEAAAPPDPEAEKEKEARKLSKKLRQAKELQQKKENGDALLPEQFEKVIRINELIRQLDSLGFDANGEKKA